MEIDERLQHIASNQLGLVTVAQALAVGVDRFALARRREAASLLPVFGSVMRLQATPPKHAQRILAGSLAVPGSAVAGISAAFVHQMPVPGAVPDLTPVVLSVATKTSVSRRGIVAVRQGVAPPTRHGMTTRVTSPEATLLLLPRFVDARVVERCLDHTLADRTASVRAIRALLDTSAVAAVYQRRLLVDLLEDRSNGMGHRSGIEQRVGRWLDEAGVHSPAP